MVNKLIPACPSSEIWNGLAITSFGRIFVWFNQPGRKGGPCIAEVMLRQQLVPYPNESWNRVFEPGDLLYSFVCIQSIRVGKKSNLWVLDKGCYEAGCVVKDSAKLIEIDLEYNKVNSIIPLNDVLYSNSEVKDMRVHDNCIFLSDIGEEALIIMMIDEGKGYRINKKTKSDEKTDSIKSADHNIGGQVLTATGGQLELSPNGEFLIYIDSNGNIRRYKTEMLLQTIAPVQNYFILKNSIQAYGPLTTDLSGNLYLIDNLQSRIVRIDPMGESMTIIEDHILRDADSLWIDEENFIWITLGNKDSLLSDSVASEIHFPVYLMKLN